jgi:hypothetical protein
MARDTFHLPHSFDDDDPPSFRRGEMKPFKQQLAKYSREKGLTEEGKRNWRAGNQGPRRKKEDDSSSEEKKK